MLMMEKITESLIASIEWAATLCFRPFKFKKWIILSFCALMAGYLAGGSYNFSLPNDYKQEVKKQVSHAQSAKPSSFSPEKIIGKAADKIKGHLFIAGSLVLVFLLIILLSYWLWARFQFIFLENVIKNDASIRGHFRKHKAAGNSLFGFSLIIGFLTLLLLGLIVVTGFNAVIKTGVFTEGPKVGILKVIFACLPSVFWFLLLIFICGIIYMILRDFMVPVMYKDGPGAVLAWEKAIAIIAANKKDVLLYVVFKFAVSLVSTILYSMIALAAFVGLLLPLGVLGGAGYLIFLALPKFIHLAYFISVFILFVPLLFSFWYFFICLYLPFAVFARTFSLKFIGRIDNEYNLFKIQTIE